jgi:phosphoglycolate phosphatase-like HAD superfamily hydrolase
MHFCLFDIDGTLINSGGAGKAALETALAEEFGLPGLRASVPYSGRTDRAIIADLLRLHGIGHTGDNLRRLVESYLRHLPRCLSSHPGRVLPGIGSLLECLRDRDDVAVGLLTGNLRAGARAKLGHFGLYDHFAFGGFGDDHLDRDDVAREALAEVRRRFDGAVRPERVWVIGDTPLDVRCARAVGARAVAVATGWHTRDELFGHAPDLLLDDLADPAPLLEFWGCGR